MFFTTRCKANYYDCDCNNQLKLSSAMKYMQQTSSEQMEHLGFSPEKLMGENMVFLLSKMCIKVHRMPLCTEQLVVGTAPLKPRGVRFLREFVMDSSEGERLMAGLSLWILVEPSTRRVLRPASFPYPFEFQAPTLEGTIGDIALPKQLARPAKTTEIPVRYSHIDVNAHVNNTVYADFVCDLLPHEQLVGRGIDTVAISFQNEAKWGERIDAVVTETEDGGYYLSGHLGDKPCFESLVHLKE